MDGGIDRAKRTLRTRMARLLASQSEIHVERASTAIVTAVTALPELARARAVGLYAALSGEPDLRPVFEAVLAAGRRGFFPRCRTDGVLDFVPISRWEDLESGRYGVLEPGSALAADPESAIDLVLVPGVAFDRTGGRLGRGRGYYDKTLAQAPLCSALRVGVAFACQLEYAVPAGPLDVSMDVLVTEQGPIRVAGERVARR